MSGENSNNFRVFPTPCQQPQSGPPGDKGDAGDGGGGGGGGDGSGEVAAWYEALPEDLKGNASVTRYAKPEDAARALIHYNGMYGVPENQLLRLPKPDDAEANAAFWNKLGRPEAPDKYGVKMPEGAPFDDAALSAFLAKMHGTGPFTPAMAKAAVDWYQGYATQTATEAKDAVLSERKASTAALKGEWGGAYDSKVSQASAAAERFGGKGLKAFLDETGEGDDPAVIKAWAAVAEATREAGAGPDDRGHDNGMMTASAARAELAQMQTDPDVNKALNDANHAQHAYYVQRRLELYKAANAAPAK